LVVVRYRSAGWDFSTYRAAVKVFQEGKDPYLVKNLLEYSDLGWPFVYPPSTLILFFPVVLLAGIIGYRVLWLLLLAASFFIVRSFDRSFQPFLFATIVTTGFMASYHNFRTGNVGLIELFFFCWTFKFIYEKRYALSAIFINLTAWLKVYPVLLGGLFIFLRKSVRSRIKSLIVLLVAFFVIGGSSLVFFPRLTLSSLGALTGRIDGQHSPADEMSGSSNPSSFLFLKDAGERLFGAVPAVPAVLFAAYAGFFIWCFIRDARRKDRDFAALFSIGTLAILLLLPRLKPYSLTLALIPVYFLMKDIDYRQKLRGLFIVGFLPLGLAVVYFVLRGLDLSSNWIGRQVFFLSGYRQLFSLLAAYIFLRRVRPRKVLPGSMRETARAQF
jgi:hypothetical protein